MNKNKNIAILLIGICFLTLARSSILISHQGVRRHHSKQGSPN
jgi:hypothetical protein